MSEIQNAGTALARLCDHILNRTADHVTGNSVVTPAEFFDLREQYEVALNKWIEVTEVTSK